MMENGYASNGHAENGHNGRHGLQEVVTTGSPYVTRRRWREDVAPEDEPSAQAKTEQNGAEEEGALAESKPKNGLRRRLGFAIFALVAVAGVGAGLYLKFGQTTKIDYMVKAKPTTSAAFQPPGQQGQNVQIGEETSGSNSQVEAAIAQMKEARGTVDGAQAAVKDNAPEISVAAPSGPTLTSLSNYAESRPARGEEFAGGAVSADGERRNPRREQRHTLGQPGHGTSSVYADEAKSSPAGPERTATNRLGPMALKAAPITLPNFGALLPVRTLGGILTLGNSIARMELTQDVKGDGWQLKKGSVFVAQSAGSALDRAYLNVSRFIDPDTNRLVKLSGEVLGKDATQGLKGKRRQMSGRWSRAFSQILRIGPGLAQAALSRNGGTTVIVPTGNELLPSGGNLDRREFVEVQAGATGYVLVTDLPEQIKGVDSKPTDHLAEEPVTPMTKDAPSALSNSELAELLVSGTPEKIKEAMPRMTPELRRIASLIVGAQEK
jgi:hypothetical protein